MLTELKRLTGAVSTPSDSDGVATFADLGFTREGRADLPGTLNESRTLHRVAFCTPGLFGSGDLRGCTLSCPFSVRSRLATIEWSVAPSTIRSFNSPARAVSPGESVRGNAPLRSLPATPVVRLLDADGRGLPSYTVKAYAYVTSMVTAHCAMEGVSFSAEEMEREPFKYLCARAVTHSFARDGVRLKLRQTDDVNFFTGPEGYLAVPLVYSLLSKDCASSPPTASERPSAACEPSPPPHPTAPPPGATLDRPTARRRARPPGPLVFDHMWPPRAELSAT